MSNKPIVGDQIAPQLSIEPELSFDVEAFDQLIRGQGVTLVHYKAMRCPIGLTDKYDIHKPGDVHADHENCSNGFLYQKAGCVTAVFQAGAQQLQRTEAGFLEMGSGVVTFPRFYDDTTEPVLVTQFDRFFIADCETKVSTWETVEASQTGVDRLQYPAVSIEYLVDSRGKEYHQGTHFSIRDGKVVWIGQEQPGFDEKLGRGVIYSVRYTYLPHWYVRQLIHEVRVAQVTNPATMERKTERLPVQVVFQREYVFLQDQRKDDESKDPRDSRSSKSGANLGPR